MTDVTNNHVTGLGMPDGTSIASRETKSYENWAVNAANGVVAHWVSTGLLSVDGYDDVDGAKYSEDATGAEAEAALAEMEESESELSEDEQKEALIAQLAELEIKADKRSSVETLQQKLDEALAK